ncbi:MAG: hypothetical protein NTW60_00780 [Candidatus Wolfebacteria bacterium]|nr:hypothetical protein [Candidatus Wolfebacteria bacterium]
MSKINWGIFSLGFFSVASAWVFGYFLKLFFVNGNWMHFGVSIAAAVVFLSVFLLNILFIKSFFSGNLIVFLSSAVILGGFYDQFSFPLLGGIALAYLFLLWGIYSGSKELDNMVRIKFWRVSKKSLSKAAIGILIFSSVAFYFNVKDLILKNPGSFFVSRPTFGILINPAEPLIKNFIPEFGLKKTVGEFSLEVAKNKTNQSKETENLSGPQKEVLAAALDLQMKEQISNLAGMNINFGMKISDAIYEILLNKIINLPNQAKSVFPYVAAAVIFFTVYGFLWVFRWIATSLSFLIYEILLALGLAVITLEGDNREEIALMSSHNY